MIAAMIAFSVSCDPPPPDYFGSINGKVTDRASGAAVLNANVILSPGGTSKQTDVDGFYEFENLEPGDYSVKVLRAGYRTDNSIVTVIAGESVSVNFFLVEGGS